MSTKIGYKEKGSYAKTLKRMRKYWFCYVMLLGTFALLITFSYYPALSAIYHIFTSEIIFRKGFANMLLLTIWQVVRSSTFPLLGAALLYRMRSEKMSYAFRMVFVLPLVVPAVVGILVWRQLYEPNFGLFNAVLIGLNMKPLAWLNSPDTALFSLMFTGFPWIDGVGLLIYLAGLLAIPAEILEAATMDGASSIRRFFAMELPLIVPQIRLIVILNVIGSLQGFGWQLLVTRGGPNNATTVPAWEMYQSAMTEGRFGVASAVGVVLFVLIFVLTLINNSYIRSNVEYQAG
ncbi:MAG: sugar ABC transporter permease [Chloroflexi bacterium]|nr:sugar ABC transporter permease [Chloroflexota bacterium]